MDDKSPALSGKPATQMIQENLRVLHKAREAFIQSEHSERIRRALAHNIRTSGEIKYITGDQVYYKRKESNEWKGPGNVLGQDSQQVLIKHGSYYVGVHPCSIKLVHQESNVAQLEKDASIVEEYENEESTVETNGRQQSKLIIPSQYLQSSDESDNEQEHETETTTLSSQQEQIQTRSKRSLSEI